jgi:preprotein translocase subunit SecG
MLTVIIVLIVLIAVLMTLVVLAQNPKGGGLSSQFGGSGTSQIMGVKRTTDLLEKLTWGFFIAMIVLTVSTNFFIEENQAGYTSPNVERAQERTVLPGMENELPIGEESTGSETPATGDTTDAFDGLAE